MALRYLEGFEHGDINVLRQQTGCSVLATPAGRSHSNFCLQCDGNSDFGYTEKVTWNATNDNVYIGFAFRTSAFSGQPFLHIRGADDAVETNVNNLNVWETLDGAITVDRSQSNATSGTELLRTEAGTLLIDTWHYIEIFWDCDSSTGSVTIWVDGVQRDTLASGNTQADTGGKPNDIWLHFDTNSADRRYDDIYILDTNTTSPQGGTSPHTTRLGDVKVIALHPTGDTADEDWTTQSGTDSFAMIDDTDVAPDDDTTYIESNTVTDYTRCTYEDNSTTGTVVGLSTYTRARKTSANAREIDVRLSTNGGTNTDDTTLTLAESYQSWMKHYDRSPGAGSAVDWTDAEFDAVELGVEVST